jgi:aspartate aminotransferase-like enzyme
MPADGAAGRARDYAEKITILRHEFDSVVPIDQSSCTLITAKIPLGWSYEAWFNACYAAGFVIYGTKGPLRDQYFQISVMGETSREDMTRFVLSARSILGTLPE